MADMAEKYTEEQIADLEKKIASVYRQAQKEIAEKLADFVKENKRLDELYRKRVEDGEMTEKAYKQWQKEQVFLGKRWEQKQAGIEKVLLNADKEAANLINGKALDVFAENANFTGYELDKGTGMGGSFAIYDATTVSKLLMDKDEQELLPRRVIDGQKAEAWNRKKIANAVMQGIIQGESIPKISKRIAQETGTANGKASIMYARTAMTSAQNAGRQERLEEAKAMGIVVKKRWLATRDSRTRDAHAHLDGQSVDVDKPFKSDFGDIMFPGDMSSDGSVGANVYNCRCTLVYDYPQFETGKRFATYEEWKNGQPDYIDVVPSAYSAVGEKSWGEFFPSLPFDERMAIGRELQENKGSMTQNEYWRSLVDGKNVNKEIERLLASVTENEEEKAAEEALELYRRFVEGESDFIHRLAGVNSLDNYSFNSASMNKEEMEKLDSVFTETDGKMHLYKGMTMTEEQIENLKGASVNHTLSSTSTDEKTARYYMEGAYDSGDLIPVLVDIDVEEGVPIADAQKLLGTGGMKAFEKEITIGRNVVWEYGEPELRTNQYGDEYYVVKATVRAIDDEPEQAQTETQPVKQRWTREEYEQAKASRDSVLKEEKNKAVQWYEDECDKIIDSLGGPFIRQRIAVKHDDSLTDKEKEARLDEIDKKREEYTKKRDELAIERDKKWKEAYDKYDLTFEPEYEYDKIEESYDAQSNSKLVNPNWHFDSFEYSHNCQRCCVAFELRERGYDVEACAAPSSGGLGAEAQIMNIFNGAETFSRNGYGHENTIAVRNQMIKWGNGARAIVIIDRDGGVPGHAFNVEMIDGRFTVIDSQLGFSWDDKDKKEDVNGGAIEDEGTCAVRLYRVDNVPVRLIQDGWIRNRRD